MRGGGDGAVEERSGYGGREVKTTGDGFLIEFPGAWAAVQCAVAVQQALHGWNEAQPAERRVRIRIGIHVGDVVLRDGDIHGDGVNIAARLEPLARPGGICCSEDVARQVGNKLDHPLGGKWRWKTLVGMWRRSPPWVGSMRFGPMHASGKSCSRSDSRHEGDFRGSLRAVDVPPKGLGAEPTAQGCHSHFKVWSTRWSGGK